MDITKENMLEITPHIISMLDGWMLRPEQVIVMLGLDGQASHRDLRKFRSKSKALPFSDEMAERIEHIIGIVQALNTTYPHSSNARQMWLRKPHRRFSNDLPIIHMLNEGIDGLTRVRVELDCSYGWQQQELAHRS